MGYQFKMYPVQQSEKYLYFWMSSQTFYLVFKRTLFIFIKLLFPSILKSEKAFWFYCIWFHSFIKFIKENCLIISESGKLGLNKSDIMFSLFKFISKTRPKNHINYCLLFFILTFQNSKIVDALYINLMHSMTSCW